MGYVPVCVRVDFKHEMTFSRAFTVKYIISLTKFAQRKYSWHGQELWLSRKCHSSNTNSSNHKTSVSCVYRSRPTATGGQSIVCLDT